MDKNEAGCHSQKYNSIDQLIKDAYGLGEEQMRKRMEWAKQEAEASMTSDGQVIPAPPDDEFQTILAKMKERGITPKVLADFDEEEKKAFYEKGAMAAVQLPEETAKEIFDEHGAGKQNKKSGSKLEILLFPLKAAGFVAACFAFVAVVMVLRPGIDVVGGKQYEYKSEVRDGEKSDIVWNNQEEYIPEQSSLEKAYDEIEDMLGINVLRLNYVPTGMKLSDTIITQGHAKLEFIYEDSRLYMFEVLFSMDNSNTLLSDCEDYITVFNEWLNREIPIKKMVTEKNDFEYVAYIEIENAHYYFYGIMEEQEFCNIIENLTI